MAEQITNAVDQPATLADLKSNLPGATSDFILSQLEVSATLQQATKVHMAGLADANAKLAEEKADADKKAADAIEKQAAAVANRGVNGLGDSGSDSEATTDPIEAYKSLFNGYLTGGMSRSKAASKMARDHNDIRLAYVEAANRRR